ncbi:MAG: helix-turn-helix domain-containing protein [Thermoleophilia bacterium]|nr:helix-turn-helix domain-containing protein [Thermoleophilia bacterium]
MERTNAADLLGEARTRARLWQTELARRSGTSQAAVARYESGQVSPAVSTLERAAVHGATNLQVVGSAARGERDTGSTPLRACRGHRFRTWHRDPG